MDLFDEDILKLWHALYNNKVEYIIIGGFAANLHGYQRFTGDLDIWLNDTIGNRKHLRKALSDYGLPDNAEYERLQFVAGWTAITLLNFFTLDIIVKIKGLENYSFNDCLSLASVATICLVILWSKNKPVSK